MPKICDCRNSIETRLEEKFNQKITLSGYDFISGKSSTPFDHKEGRRNKTSYMFHAYCPFCGKKYGGEKMPEIVCKEG